MKNAVYPKALLLIFIFIWIILAIKPHYRADWLLENLLVFITVPLLILAHRKAVFSNISYTLLFIFLVFHSIGAHYTYSEVPVQYLIGNWAMQRRNHYDRFVHFIFGLVVHYPAREIFIRFLNATSVWKNLLPLMLVISLGACYELLEWVTVKIVAPDAGIAFLGVQGDVFDAQKDLSLNLLGALLAIAAGYFFSAVKGVRKTVLQNRGTNI